MEIKFLDDRLKNLKIIIKKNNGLAFSELINLTGWDEMILTFVLSKLLDMGTVDEYFDDEIGKILYKIVEFKNNDLLTIQERKEKYK